ncbi:MAG TPA: phytanoyl-CoA dioxygenase family protein [Acidimicrobiales bacterium]|nr:phytanoyl-CoA dioxygenase family protein [Acidimicrobiales bacterium]
MTVVSTTDLARARADLDEHGYCLVEAALSPDEVARMRQRIVELAAAEVADGTDYVYENGSNQRVWALLNKGEMFVDLALHPLALELMEHLLGYGFLLSNIDANIAGPGGQPMFLHADQSYVPPPWPWKFPLVANIMWMLDDFTATNGATRVVPGSHLLGHGPDPSAPGETVAACAPAGTALVFDGRLWHQTGANTTADQRRHGILAYYCRPFMRQQENWFVSLRPEVLEAAPARLRQLLGWENYLSLGMIDGMPRNGPRY